MEQQDDYEDFLAEARRAFERGAHVDEITRVRVMRANAAAFRSLAEGPRVVSDQRRLVLPGR